MALIDAEASAAIKVGIGPRPVCTTRIVRRASRDVAGSPRSSKYRGGRARRHAGDRRQGVKYSGGLAEAVPGADSVMIGSAARRHRAEARARCSSTRGVHTELPQHGFNSNAISRAPRRSLAPAG